MFKISIMMGCLNFTISYNVKLPFSSKIVQKIQKIYETQSLKPLDSFVFIEGQQAIVLSEAHASGPRSK